MAVFELGVARRLALTEILNGAEMVTRNGFHIFNDFLNNHSLGVGLLDSLMVDSLGGAIEQALLSEAEAVRFGLALDNGVAGPVVLADALLARVVVAVGAFVHFGVGCIFVSSAASREQDVLGLDAVLGGETKSSLAVFSSLRPLVIPGVAFAEGLSLDRVVLALHGVVEFVSETRKVLGLDYLSNVVTHVLGFAVGVILGQVLFVFLHAGVHLDQAWLNVRELAVLADVRRSARVAWLLVREQILTDAVV